MYASAAVVLLVAFLYTVFVCCSRVNALQRCSQHSTLTKGSRDMHIRVCSHIHFSDKLTILTTFLAGVVTDIIRRFPGVYAAQGLDSSLPA